MASIFQQREHSSPGTGSETPKQSMPDSAVAADLCCGMGGLSFAAESLGLKVVAGIDTDESALRTFEKNFPGAKAILNSIRSSTAIEEVGNLAQQFQTAPLVILSGPPCQGFSAAGSRNPVDPRNQILVGVGRAIVELQPRCALIENVPTLLSETHRPRLKQLVRVLAEGGYFVQTLLLNAADFGVPQQRKRAFVFVMPRDVHADELSRRLGGLKTPAPTASQALSGLPKPRVRPDEFDDEEEFVGVANHFAMRHSPEVRAKIAAIKPGSGPMSYRRLHPRRPSNTLFSGNRAPPAHYSQSRSITVREAARLQGFPDTFRIYGTFSLQMGQVTNAVPPPLARAALSILLDVAGVQLQ